MRQKRKAPNRLQEYERGLSKKGDDSLELKLKILLIILNVVRILIDIF